MRREDVRHIASEGRTGSGKPSTPRRLLPAFRRHDSDDSEADDLTDAPKSIWRRDVDRKRSPTFKELAGLLRGLPRPRA